MDRRDAYAWRNFGHALDRARNALKAYQYRGVFEAPVGGPPNLLHDLFPSHGQPYGTLSAEQIDFILSSPALGPPHGLALLEPLPPSELPVLPAVPDRALMGQHDGHWLAQHATLVHQLEQVQAAVAEKRRTDAARGAQLAAAYRAGDDRAVRYLVLTTLLRHPLPTALMAEPKFALDRTARVALCTIEVPDLARLSIVKRRGDKWNAKWSPVSEAERKRSTERVLHALCVRAAYLVAASDPLNLYDTVAINAHQRWFDPATGNPREGIIASLQAAKTEIQTLQPGHLDAKACFRHLAGIATPNLFNAAPVRPIFVMDTDDERVVPNKDVADGLDEEANLATMPWEDFEHLVRQLFEWMFARDGIDVVVTRASRDRGVDAIMFDPDPVRGGKYVLQAKRYTRTVDVAAVRDLYGTVVNEGANRGILVTTASYGPDAYEFAKNKPISLIDGPNLIALLRKHDRNYRIDLEEARRAEAEQR